MRGRALEAGVVVLLPLVLLGRVDSSLAAPLFTTIDTFAGVREATFDPFENEGGAALDTKMSPLDLAVDSAGNVYFVGATAQGVCNCLGAAPQVRRIEAATNIVTTIVGDGTADYGGENLAAVATGVSIHHIGLDGDNRLLIGDTENQRIRSVDLDSGLIHTIAGNGDISPFYTEGGPATASPLQFPDVPVVRPAGGVVFAFGYPTPLLHGELFGSPVLKIDDDTGVLSTYTNGPSDPDFQALSIVFDEADNMYMSGFNEGDPIYRVDAASGQVAPLAGGGASLADSGPGLAADLAQIDDLAFADGYLYVASTYFPNGVDTSLIWAIDVSDGSIHRVVGDLDAILLGDGGPAIDARINAVQGLAVAPDGDLLISTDHSIRRVQSASLLENIVIDDATPQDFLDSVTDAPASVLAQDTARLDVLLPNLVGVGANLIVTGNANLVTLDLPNLATVAGAVTIDNNPNLQSIDLGDLNSSGDIVITDNATAANIDLGGLSSTGGGITITDNATANNIDLGSLQSADGDITITDNATAANIDLGGLSSTGGGITITDNATANNIDLGSLANVGGDVTIDDNGDPSLTFSTPQITIVGGFTIGDADIVIQDGSQMDVELDLVIGDRASLEIDEDSRVEAGNVHVRNGGAVRGRGAIAADIIFNSGVFAPGASPGMLTADGDFFQDADGVLQIEIAGLEAGVAYDVLHVTGDLTAQGRIELEFLDNFAPRLGQQFDFLVIDGQTDVSGATFEIRNLAPGFLFDISQVAGGVTLTALSDARFVPEPPAAPLFGAAAVAVLWFRGARRRRPPRRAASTE